MSYYENSSQWPASGQVGWDHQTPPPARSGASSVVPREEPAAFTYQLEEVDRAIDNLVKSGKMFGVPGRRESLPSFPGPARAPPAFDPRSGGPNAGSRSHSVAEFGESGGRGQHQGSNLQNFYAAQRHQSSRGSNEAEQMMQAKRRMAAQRERELRNYHQEQQYNRTVLAELTYAPGSNKPDRTLSPGSMSEDERRELIARQRSALYGEGPFAEGGGYVDETGTPRPGFPAPPSGPGSATGLRGHSPLTYEYGRTPPAHPDAGPQPPAEGPQPGGPNQRSRANSNASPQSAQASNKGAFDLPRTSNSSPSGSPSNGKPPGGSAVAPIGTRPSGAPGSAAQSASNPALGKRTTTPLPSPLSHGLNALGGGDDKTAITSSGPSNPASAATEGSVGLTGWGSRSGVWGNKSGLGVQASVWG